MRTLQHLGFCVITLAASRLGAEGFLDRIDEALTLSAFHDQVRARFSGLMDVEGYHFQQPAPGLIDATGDSLFTPRLTLFLDTQLGSHVYFFAQSRLDRGFDPSDRGAQLRLDEYALRMTPWEDGRLNFQIGKFATAVGNWKERHLSWENPFITAPLAYENVTAIHDAEAPRTVQEFLHGSAGEKYESNPVIWGPSYATGASVAGRIGKFEYAAEVKNASLSSRPESWDAAQIGFDNPTFSGRIGFLPDPMWNLGFSASNGSYLRPEAGPTLAGGRGTGDYREVVLGQDVHFAWHHVQLWAEVYESRFEVPNVGDADAVAYDIEAKYKFTPQFFGALRWNHQIFGTVADGQSGQAPWGHDLWRFDTAIGYRFTAHTQIKLQHSFQHEKFGPREISNLIAAQFTVRF
jgi:hypothetical protein